MVSKKCLPLGYYSNFTVLLPSVHRPLGWPRKALPGLHEFAFFESMTFMRTIIPWSCWNHQTKTSRKDLYTDANRGVSLKELSQRRRSGYSCGAHMEPVHCYNAAFLPHRVVCSPLIFTGLNNEHRYVVLSGVCTVQSILQLVPRRIIHWPWMSI